MRGFIATVAFCLVFVVSGALGAEPENDLGPFESVVQKGDTIVATIDKESGGWYVFEGERASNAGPGEFLIFHEGTTMILYVHTASYTLTARLSSKPAGLAAVSDVRVNAVGDDEERRFFIKAQ